MTNRLERITTVYVAAEDRLRLTGELASTEVQTIWLTQRLLVRLVPLLTQWLEGQHHAARGPDKLRTELLQTFAQQAARANPAAQSPVRASAASPAWLAEAVDVKRGSSALTLTFRNTDSHSASLTLAPKPLRQWLGIVYDVCVGPAQWPAVPWPVWLHEGAAGALPQAKVLH
jgi:hypothetical protein